MLSSRNVALMTSIILFTAGEVFLSILLLLFFFRNGSLRADIKVLATSSNNMYGRSEGEFLTQKTLPGNNNTLSGFLPK